MRTHWQMSVDATLLSRSYQLSASLEAVSISTSNENQSPFVSPPLLYEISEVMGIKAIPNFQMAPFWYTCEEDRRSRRLQPYSIGCQPRPCTSSELFGPWLAN